MAIAISQTVIGSATAGTSFLLATMTPAANDLILVAVATRNAVQVTGVSGNGITFTLVRDQQQTLQGAQTRLSLWRGMSASPTAGQITVTCGATIVAAAAQAHRITGIDIGGTNGSAAIEATNGAETGATDTAAPAVNITTLSAGARAYACFSHRTQAFTLGAGETAITLNTSIGTAGNVTRLSTEYQDTASPATVTLDGTLAGAIDWLAVGVAIRPAGAGVPIGGNDSTTATDTGALDAASSVTDSASAIEGASASSATVGAVDSASLSDISALSIQQAIVAIDALTLANTATVETATGDQTVVGADAVTMAEASGVIAQAFTGSDSATVSDTALVTVPLSATDSLALTEGAGAIARSSVSTDSAALSDTSALTTANVLTGSDSAALSDTSLLNTNTLTIASSDSAVLSELATNGLKAATDSAALAESASVSSTINVAKAATDSAALTDTAAVTTILLTASDVVTMADTRALSWASLVSDSAALADAQTLAATLTTLTDTAALTDTSVIFLSASDVITMGELPASRETPNNAAATLSGSAASQLGIGGSASVQTTTSGSATADGLSGVSG